MTRAFADTNSAVYALDIDIPKRQKALKILKASPVISTQVINEFLVWLCAKRRFLDQIPIVLPEF